MLELDNVSYHYKAYRCFSSHKIQVLRHIDLKLESGTIYGIMGASGSGKSTLAKILGGLYAPNADECGNIGQVSFNNAPLKLESSAQRKAFFKQVQMLFQDSISSLNPRFSVFENIYEPLMYFFNLNKAEAFKLITPLMAQMRLSEGLLSQNVSAISGGEAQRICLLRALCVNPKLLILDECTSNLDYELALDVLDMLKAWQNKRTIVLITHDESIARRLCDEVLRLENGCLAR